MEIQKALADRGYLKNEPSGVWDAASQDAMRTFQADQKLDPSGKLTAASLIALGLGPKRESPVARVSADASPHPAGAPSPAQTSATPPVPANPVSPAARQ